jgi:hypothetical protein
MTRNAVGINEMADWRRTLSRHIWFLRSAGITAAEIEQAIARCLGQSLKIRKLLVPVTDERMYSRILVHWRHDSAYLDNRGQPRALRLEGPPPTFRSLIRAAVPGADASRMLGLLKRYRLVSQSSHGVVRLITGGFSPSGDQQGYLLGTTLASLEALMDTCYANLHAGQPMRSAQRLQLRAYTEYLDRRHLGAYEEFLNESGQVFLAMHETWLKRHEVKRVDPRHKQTCRVGVGVFAIRDP